MDSYAQGCNPRPSLEHRHTERAAEAQEPIIAELHTTLGEMVECK